MARESIGPITPADVEFALKHLESVVESPRILDEWFKSNPSEDVFHSTIYPIGDLRHSVSYELWAREASHLRG